MRPWSFQEVFVGEWTSLGEFEGCLSPHKVDHFDAADAAGHRPELRIRASVPPKPID